MSPSIACLHKFLFTSPLSGEKLIHLLARIRRSQKTNGCAAAAWQMHETLFQRLESVLHSEMITLRRPRAALLAFGVAALAWNVLAVLQEAVKASHDLAAAGIELSPYYLALEIKAHNMRG